ncbi:hypothetical protein E5D57_006030 [Metarhizium anisopliae]|nr:hypothetical protein E5D57_006030 [Metarhizium anisopliae]
MARVEFATSSASGRVTSSSRPGCADTASIDIGVKLPPTTPWQDIGKHGVESLKTLYLDGWWLVLRVPAAQLDLESCPARLSIRSRELLEV